MTSSGISDKFKNAFKVGGRKKDNVEDIQPLAHGAHGKVWNGLLECRIVAQSTIRAQKKTGTLRPCLLRSDNITASDE